MPKQRLRKVQLATLEERAGINRARKRGGTVEVPRGVADMLRMVNFHAFYRRAMNGTIYIRDSEGRYLTVDELPNGNYKLGAARDVSLGPTYNRVDYSNTRRFVGQVRSHDLLEQAYGSAPHRKIRPIVDLPAQRNATRRHVNQGMGDEMNTLLGNRQAGATDYAMYCRGLLARPDPGYEWCHLVAHSMGGPDTPDNIVAARKGNNSEQLAIENALSAYRREDLFQIEISAAVASQAGVDKHMGDVILYKIMSQSEILYIYLDCKVEVDPSGIHHLGLTRDIAQWANRKCAAEHNPGELPAAERRDIIRWLRRCVAEYL